MFAAFMASVLASWCTCLGALPLFFIRSVPHRWYDAMLGMSAGIMLTASGVSLIEPAIHFAKGAPLHVFGGMVIGVVFMAIMERYLPHLEPHFSAAPVGATVRRGVLVALAITIHNFPEGFSTGVGYYSLPHGQGLALAAAIGVQNIPEGLAVALPLWKTNISPWRAFLLTWLSSVAEPLAGLAGILLVHSVEGLLPWAMGFAGGAMIYVSLIHLLPESFGHKHETEASIGVVAGILLMLILEFSFSN